VATQRRMESFIDEGATARKAILNRFLDLDIFEKLYGLVKEDVATFRKLLARYGVDKHLDPRQRQTAEQLFVQMLDASYALTKASIGGDKTETAQPAARGPSAEQRQAQERFNALFKPI